MTLTKIKNMDHWNATDYSQHSSAQSIWADELIQKLDLKGRESVLDIGCGDGTITARIANQLEHGEIVGIDSSHSMFSLALAQLTHSDDSNLGFHVMDAMHIKLDKTFDIAFSNAALHWIPDHQAVLASTRKHLNSSGRLLFQMGGKDNVAGLLDVIGEIISATDWGKYFNDFTFPYHFYDIDDYAQWLPANGFKADRIELMPKKMVHNNAEELKGWFRTTWFPYTNRLPGEKRDEFIDTVIDEYLADNPLDSQGKTMVEMVRLEVEANCRH